MGSTSQGQAGKKGEEGEAVLLPFKTLGRRSRHGYRWAGLDGGSCGSKWDQMFGPWGPYLFRGEPEQQEVKVLSREEVREAGEGAGLEHLKSPSSLSLGVGSGVLY